MVVGPTISIAKIPIQCAIQSSMEFFCLQRGKVFLKHIGNIDILIFQIAGSCQKPLLPIQEFCAILTDIGRL